MGRMRHLIAQQQALWQPEHLEIAWNPTHFAAVIGTINWRKHAVQT